MLRPAFKLKWYKLFQQLLVLPVAMGRAKVERDPQVNIVSDQKNYQQILPFLIKTNLLPKALTILTNAEHHRQLLCALRFIYKQKPMMNRLQYNMCYDCSINTFCVTTFSQIFLHWDYVVRVYFFHLLVYRLFSVPRQEMRLESDLKIVKNLMEVVLSRKRRRTPEDDLNSSFNARVAHTIDDFVYCDLSKTQVVAL